MKRSSSARRFLPAVLTSLLLFGLLPAAPAAAATITWSLHSKPVSVTAKDGNTYLMTMSAYEYGGEGDSVSISLSRTKNPDGTGPLKATQTVDYNFNITGNRFTHGDNSLQNAAVDTAGEMGVYGTMDLKFNDDGSLVKRCNGHIRQRAGVISGTMSFKTNTNLFGTITKRPARATMTWSDGGECGTTTTVPCGSSYRSVNAGRFASKPLSISGSKVEGAKTANASAFASNGLLNKEGTMLRYIYATLPASNLTVPNGLGSASLQGAKGTWLSGTMNYKAAAPAHTSPPQNCGTSKETVDSGSNGNATGNFTADFFVGPNRGVGEAPMDYASANRTVVRARS